MMYKNRAAELRAWAIEEGFDRAGVARLAPSENAQAFTDWLGRGDHAEMQYLERRLEVRLDSREILSGARSVLCVALQYHPVAAEEVPGWRSLARGRQVCQG